MTKTVLAAAALTLGGIGMAMAQQAPSSAPRHSTEPQARAALMGYGSDNVSGLSMGPHGSWYGMCSKGDAIRRVAVNPQGKAGPATNMESRITAGNARAILMSKGCSTVSSLALVQGAWQGTCAKGGRHGEGHSQGLSGHAKIG